MIPTFSSKLGQLRRFSATSQSLYKVFCRNIITENFFFKKVDQITSDGRFIRCFSVSTQSTFPSTKMNEENQQDFNVNYDDILKAQKDNKVLIIDVREDSEIQETGKLPGSIHIPMSDVANTLSSLSSVDFEKKYNKKKPTEDTRIILSCRSGKRSAMVQSDILKLGYKNAYNYSGGWLDWESHQKS